MIELGFFSGLTLVLAFIGLITVLRVAVIIALCAFGHADSKDFELRPSASRPEDR